MTDKELLELAAKAAGIVVRGLADRFVVQHGYGKEGLCVANDKGGDSLWNPLTNDGDARRLAVKLGLQVTNRFGFTEVVVPGARGDSGYVEADKGDPYTASRRAIVRAAAQLGKDMK